jgi:5'-methylthioadenosine phosphorylase
MLGIIAGSAFLRGAPEGATEPTVVPTDRGDVTVHPGDGYVFLRRHGHERYEPPHRIPHHAHALALERLGVEQVVGLASVGALKADIAPGTAAVPDDYLSFHPPPTFAESERLHIVPTLDEGLRGLLLDVARQTDGPVRDGGVYAETRGPRFETRAEIRLLADYAHYVGMTAASEATLLQERGMAYAVLGIVDNLAHGLDAEPLTLERFDAMLEANRARARAIVDGLVRRCAP